jgi:hypothetical protein
MSEYDYTQTPCAIDALTQQIQQSTIVTALDHINQFGAAVSIFFKSALSDADKATLDALVAAQNGIPLPPNQVQTVSVANSPVVTTQYELNNKDLKIACTSAELPNDGVTTSITASLKVPGTFGSSQGRYVAGGYGITEDYNKDDRALLYVSDDDRNVAMALALASNPSATTPLTDAEVIALGTLPAPFSQAFPSYPIVKTYYDDQCASANQGWYFWAEAQGNTLGPTGEIELTPLAGYAFMPAGFYLKVQYIRPAGTFTGGIRINLDWGMADPTSS